ncbi:ABC transporter ATP-binding protein [candidate division WOR-3 bacterium]|nr:ABC transporter ATP-binding protein [candidate division WOR-3 bacterium]
MIRARNLKKVFGSIVAVNSINLEIKNGEIYGFLGPNGAGKTTTIRMLTGTLKPTSGEIEILGIPLDKNEIEVKKRIGVVFEEPKLYENLRGTEFIDFIIAIYKLDREKTLAYLSELTEAFNIDYLDGFIGDYSHGMKQKLALVSVLMRRPEVVFLDEPTVGLDARSAKILKMLLEKITSEGRTIFMTTHILEIAEKMCSRIGIINRGELIAEGTLKELRKLSKTGSKSLEDLFLELTGGEEIAEIVEAL